MFPPSAGQRGGRIIQLFINTTTLLIFWPPYTNISTNLFVLYRLSVRNLLTYISRLRTPLAAVLTTPHVCCSTAASSGHRHTYNTHWLTCPLRTNVTTVCQKLKHCLTANVWYWRLFVAQHLQTKLHVAPEQKLPYLSTQLIYLI